MVEVPLTAVAVRFVGAGTPTVTAAVPLFPSLVAVMVADPSAFAVASPDELTATTAALLLDQVTVRPDRVLPLASFSVAVSCCVPPTPSVAEAGETVTVATGADGLEPTCTCATFDGALSTPLSTPITR